MNQSFRNLEMAAFGLCLAKAGGELLTACEISQRMGFGRVESVLRSAVEAGTTSDPDWAGNLVDYRQVVESFVEGLRSISVFDAMLPASRRVPLRSQLAVVTSTANGAATGEGALKPITQLALDAGGLDPAKATAVTVVTDSLLRFATSAALNLLNRELRGGVTAATNARFLADLATGISPISSTGDPLVDLRAALAVVSTHGTSRLFWIVDPLRAVQLATFSGTNGEPAFPTMSPVGGSIAGVTVAVSDQVPEDSNGTLSLVVDADQVAMGSETITLRASRYGDLVMDDAPGSGEQELVSLFQSNSVAILAERWFGSQRLRDSAVSTISGADYGAQS